MMDESILAVNEVEHEEEEEEPERLLCPITRQVFQDPVFVPESGNTYEREALLQFWGTCPIPRDPLTNVSLRGQRVFTNWTKRREVQDYLEQYPNRIPGGWPNRRVPPPQEENKGKPKKFATAKYKRLAACFLSSLITSLYVWKRVHASRKVQIRAEKLVQKNAPSGFLLKIFEGVDSNDMKLLRILIPTKEVDSDVAMSLIFPTIWLTFVAIWTRGAYRAGIGFAALFSLPFWSTGLWLLKSVLSPVIQETEVVLSPTAFSIAYDIVKIGWLRYVVRGKSTDITGCSLETLSYLNGQPIKYVVLKEGLRNHAFGRALRHREKEFVCLEILDYLKQNVGLDLSQGY
mmetsp:Transcript_7759/g.8906  ORF Transcript_7759/g.8906 Transcript_7759/m.8906 type:complete len:346 (-) Transcript_7759:115-1152(-)|eukprot:CAMPEP_0184021688 /NCGR_PEP_ID=MMETSP0954-20121128/10092_1 /TAXON_ID=627963 /ORGANISM="Aplanochytrium sp, Strain PBS07" /LENGTH=345 /DNA_ID=CAMNT_0026303785 /DNA_START=244 /DNA_END=1281 /DNA_ORIENTATION=+